MRAGLIRHRLQIDEPVIVFDAAGSEITSWVSRLLTWASFEPLTGREALNASQALATIDTRIVVRWSPAMDAVVAKWRGQRLDGSGQRVGLVYNFESVAHVNFNRQQVDILARSGAAGP